MFTVQNEQAVNKMSSLSPSCGVYRKKNVSMQSLPVYILSFNNVDDIMHM